MNTDWRFYMALLDIKGLVAEVEKEVNDELRARMKGKIKTQLQIVEQARTVLKNEQRKLDDILESVAESS